METGVETPQVLGALSPSRAGDFVSCPLLFRFRTIDRLPEGTTPDAVRGTLVHSVLEQIFDLPAADRTPERARGLVEPAWAALKETSRESAAAVAAVATVDEAEWLASARDSVGRWFALEDPTRLEPADRELYVETVLDEGLKLRGIIDRVDVAPDGAIRISDYKGLALDTPLPTPTGWTSMGEVQVGDVLFGTDGRPTRVVEKSGVHHRPCYEITFGDGTKVTCDNVHLWTVVTSRRQRRETLTVDADGLAELHRRMLHEGTPNSLWVEGAAGLELDAAELPIDPWLLGAWLGDGSTRSTELARAGVRGDKHIPPVYLRASTSQRIDLLRGLMDTDGWWSKARHRAGYPTSNDRLAADVIELLGSLGLQPLHFTRPCTNPVRAARTWHVVEFTPLDFNPFSLPRKAQLTQLTQAGATDLERELSSRRVVVSVESVRSVPTQCVAVDAADLLYLCGRGFVPTHNTGGSPREGSEARSLFQLRLYGLILWRLRGVVPRQLRLVYLGNSEIITEEPDQAALKATERKVLAIWEAIREARKSGVFEPSPGRQCDWCPHHALCPVFGGVTPPMPPTPAKPPATRWRAWLRRLRRRFRSAD